MARGWGAGVGWGGGNRGSRETGVGGGGGGLKGGIYRRSTCYVVEQLWSTDFYKMSSLCNWHLVE